MRTGLIVALGGLALAACNQQQPQANPANEPAIKVRASEQERTID